MNSTDGLLLAAPLGLMVRSPKEKAVRCAVVEDVASHGTNSGPRKVGLVFKPMDLQLEIGQHSSTENPGRKRGVVA